MNGYASRLDHIEAALGKATRPNRLIMLTLKEGEDPAPKIAEVRRARGLPPDVVALISVEAMI